MDTIVDQLEKYRTQRHEAAQWKYSQILQRFDSPQPGDAEMLDQAMVELKIDFHQLLHDVHLIQRYRAYADASKNPGNDEEKQQAQKDAHGIREGSKTLFLAWPNENGNHHDKKPGEKDAKPPQENPKP